MTQQTQRTTTQSTTSSVAELAAKMNRIVDELNERYLERDEQNNVYAVAFVAGQHVMNIGPAGEGKTGLAKAWAERFVGARFFTHMMDTKTKLEHIFGGTDMQALLERNKVRYDTTHMMTDSHIVLLDEFGKADGDTLNALLAWLAERIFTNGGVVERSPLVTFIGASNEIPEADDDRPSLAAFLDRLTLRVITPELSRAAARKHFRDAWARRARTANGENTSGAVGTTLTLDELARLQDAAQRVELTELVFDAFFAILDELEAQGLPKPSTRRREWLQGLIAASAVLAGRDTTELEDLLILQHALWQDVEQIPAVRRVVFSAAMPALATAQDEYDAIVASYKGTLSYCTTYAAPAYAAQRVVKRADTLAQLKTAESKLLAALDTARRARQVSVARVIQTWGRDVRAMKTELTSDAKVDDPSWG